MPSASYAQLHMRLKQINTASGNNLLFIQMINSSNEENPCFSYLNNSINFQTFKMKNVQQLMKIMVPTSHFFPRPKKVQARPWSFLHLRNELQGPWNSTQGSTVVARKHSLGSSQC